MLRRCQMFWSGLVVFMGGTCAGVIGQDTSTSVTVGVRRALDMSLLNNTASEQITWKRVWHQSPFFLHVMFSFCGPDTFEILSSQ
jgi:hypothetical protein